jgi:hypothetical protein
MNPFSRRDWKKAAGSTNTEEGGGWGWIIVGLLLIAVIKTLLG